jgi:hypothetical protein
MLSLAVQFHTLCAGLSRAIGTIETEIVWSCDKNAIINLAKHFQLVLSNTLP